MTVEYTPDPLTILSVAVILLILIAVTAGDDFPLFNTEESEESIAPLYTSRENTGTPTNIQMNLGSGKIVSTDGSITNLDVEELNISEEDGFMFGGKRFMVVTPSAWHVKLQSWSDDAQRFDANAVNNLINQGEYFVTYAGKSYSPIALHTSPGFGGGDSWRLTDMRGFQGSGRNPLAQGNAHDPNNKIDAGGAFYINRRNEVDGSGFWTIELKSKNKKGKVVIFT